MKDGTTVADLAQRGVELLAIGQDESLPADVRRAALHDLQQVTTELEAWASWARTVPLK